MGLVCPKLITGPKATVKRRMMQSKDYAEWSSHALALDKYENFCEFLIDSRAIRRGG